MVQATFLSFVFELICELPFTKCIVKALIGKVLKKGQNLSKSWYVLTPILR